MTFEQDYFVQSKRSNYRDYRKRKFDDLADDLITLVSMPVRYRILDFGCGTGGLVAEFIKRGYKKVVGTDISRWAIEYGRQLYNLDERVLMFHNVQLIPEKHDVVLFIDVLEHIPDIEEIEWLIRNIKPKTEIVVRLPVSAKEGEHFVLEVSRNDETHVQVHPKDWWLRLFQKCGVKKVQKLKGKAIYDSEGVLAVVLEK